MQSKRLNCYFRSVYYSVNTSKITGRGLKMIFVLRNVISINTKSRKMFPVKPSLEASVHITTQICVHILTTNFNHNFNVMFSRLKAVFYGLKLIYRCNNIYRSGLYIYIWQLWIGLKTHKRTDTDTWPLLWDYTGLFTKTNTCKVNEIPNFKNCTHKATHRHWTKIWQKENWVLQRRTVLQEGYATGASFESHMEHSTTWLTQVLGQGLD